MKERKKFNIIRRVTKVKAEKHQNELSSIF